MKRNICGALIAGALTLSCLQATAAPLPAGNDGTPAGLRGYVGYSSRWGNQDQSGFYSVPMAEDGDFTLQGLYPNFMMSGYDDGAGTFYGDALVYGNTTKDCYIYQLDTQWWVEKSILRTDYYNLVAWDVALDPTTGVVYAASCGSSGIGNVWSRINYATLTVEEIAPLDIEIVALGCTKDGQFYAASYNGGFFKINKVNGQAELISNTGITHAYPVGGCVNDRNNTLVVSQCLDNSGSLFEIDLATGEPTKLLDFPGGEQVTCLYFPEVTPTYTAPAKAGNLLLSWADGVVTLTWDAVTKTIGGADLAGNVTYNIYDKHNNLVAEGLSANTFTADVAVEDGAFEALQYSVVAVCGEIDSLPATSEILLVGGVTTPLEMDMDVLANFNRHTVVDANGDGKGWVFDAAGNHTLFEYSTKNPGDDWLISPAILLEGGKTYLFKANLMNGSVRWDERYEIKLGTSLDPSSFTTEIVPPTVIEADGYSDVNQYITIEATGQYFIGFHAISDMDMYKFALLEYSLSAPVSVQTPGLVTDISITPDADGALKADVSCKAPATTAAGQPLTVGLKVEVKRNGEIIKILDAAPGETVSFVDEVDHYGAYTYAFVAVAENDLDVRGLAVDKSVYIGPAAPERVTNISAVELTPGTITMKWDAAAADINGRPLNPANVTYNVFTVNGEWLGAKLNDAPLTEPSFTGAFDSPAVQDFCRFAVIAMNQGVGSDFFSTPLVPCGPAYTMPMVLSSYDDLDSYILATGGNAAYAGVCDDEFVPSFDNDDTAFYLQHRETGTSVGTFVTGKVAVEGSNPLFRMAVYKVADADANTTDIVALQGSEVTPLGTIDNTDLQTGWNVVSVSLTPVKGKEVQIRIEGNLVSHIYQVYDRFEVADVPHKDVAVTLTAPLRVKPGHEFELYVTAENLADQPTGAFDIEFLRNGDVAETISITDGLAVGSSRQFMLLETLTLFDGDVDFEVRSLLPGDEVADNDAAASTVVRVLSNLPGIENLTGETTTEGNILQWHGLTVGDPEAEEVLEDVELAESFSTELEGWTFVDRDQQPVGGIEGVEIPGITPGESLGSFFVLDSQEMGAGFEAHSGTKCLASMYRWDSGQSDEWLISPLLSGDEQIITFWARSFHPTYPESIQVYVSTKDSKNPADFMMCYSYPELSTRWDKVEVELGKNTRRFAIRACSSDGLLLLLDDFKFTALQDLNAVHLGYNVYCDRQLLTPVPVQTERYLHLNPTTDHTYHVSSVYDRGESELSAPLQLTLDGVETVVAPGVTVAVDNRVIIISAPNTLPVAVNTLDGRTLFVGNGDARVSVAPGIYLVTVGTTTAKLLVK